MVAVAVVAAAVVGAEAEAVAQAEASARRASGAPPRLWMHREGIYLNACLEAAIYLDLPILGSSIQETSVQIAAVVACGQDWQSVLSLVSALSLASLARCASAVMPARNAAALAQRGATLTLTLGLSRFSAEAGEQLEKGAK
eukprot:6191860-Pleurochrysis_carterae.AAC.7